MRGSSEEQVNFVVVAFLISFVYLLIILFFDRVLM